MKSNCFLSSYREGKLRNLNEPIWVECELDTAQEIVFELKIEFNDIFVNQVAEYDEILSLYYSKNTHDVELEKKRLKRRFVYLPWKNALFSTVDDNVFYELLTWRNKEKLTAVEQDHISRQKITLVGTSVGSFAAKILAKSGYRYFNLFEIKSMKPSNAPRMYCDSFTNYGEHKLIPLVHALYELNPYMHINFEQNGFNRDNGIHMLKEADLVFDCADDPETKLLIHELSEKFQRPIITGFDELGALIIFRYDFVREDRTYFLGEFNVKELAELKKNDIQKYIVKLLDFMPGPSGIDKLSKRQIETIKLILNNKRGGFAQLAWEASLFGACTVKAAIDITLGENVEGFIYLDLDELITRDMALPQVKMLTNM